MQNNNEYLTVPQAAVACGVSRGTLWRWVKSNHLKSLKTPGGHYRIQKQDLEAFLKHQTQPGSKPGAARKKILIVDDDQQVRRTLKKLLSAEGYVVELSKDGFEAGLMVHEFMPELVILDLFMPEIDGFEVCRRLKQGTITKGIKIIILTGYPTDKNERKIREAGADDFITKPIDTGTILKRVAQHL